jgi:PEP-CTERM motif
MTLQCMTGLRALGARAHHYLKHAKHAAHHLGRHHVHHAGHWVGHHIVVPTTVRVMVCALLGVATVAIGGVAPNGTGFPSLIPGEVSPPATPPLAFVAGGVGGSAGAPGTFDSSTIGSLGASQLFAPSEAAELVGPSSFSETGGGGLPQLPPLEWPDSAVPPGTAGPPSAVPEPASMAVLMAGLLGLALSRCRLLVEPTAGEAEQPLGQEDDHRDKNQPDKDQVVFREKTRQSLAQQ